MMIQQRVKKWSAWGVAVAFLVGWAWSAGVGPAAAGAPLARVQGLIMERDGLTLVINERPFVLTRETKVLSMKKLPMSEDQLVKGQWVALLAEPSSSGGQKINTIYLLPRRLDGPALTLLFAEQPN
jgi:hypothetical protein